MKTADDIKRRLIRLRQAVEELEVVTIALIEHKRHGEATRNMQQESAIRDQIALLEWVLKD